MADIRDLTAMESVEKIHEMVRHSGTCLFCTELKTDRPFMTRPMEVELGGVDGTLWFLSDVRSDKAWQILNDDYVQLLFSSSGHVRFMSLFGRASVYLDREVIEQLWEPIAKAWLKGGKNDPNISVIRFTPIEGYYWESRHGRIVSFLKMVGSLATGKEMDDIVQGRVDL